MIDNKTANILLEELKYAVEESKDHKTQWDVRLADVGIKLKITVLPK